LENRERMKGRKLEKEENLQNLRGRSSTVYDEGRSKANEKYRPELRKKKKNGIHLHAQKYLGQGVERSLKGRGVPKKMKGDKGSAATD